MNKNPQQQAASSVMSASVIPVSNASRSICCGQRLRRSHALRRTRAATILEVLFAIFVVIVGLMGIASLIPMAARNAQESNAHNNALTQGRIWVGDFVARGLSNPAQFSMNAVGYNWVWRFDTGAPAPLVPFSKLGTAGGGPTSNYSDADHSALLRTRTWQQMSVCIDPLFMSDPDVVQGFNTGSTRLGAYRAAVFPYYEHGYNPIEDAALETGINPWQDQPRMLRVSLGGGAGQIPAKLAKELFVSKDDLSLKINDSDKTIPATRSFSVTPTASGGVQLNKELNSGDYSWFATVSPEFSSTPLAVTKDYVLSVVIMQRRDRQFISAASPPVAGSDTNKPSGERLVWVVPLSGNFTNGNGGRVRLIANAAVDDSVHVGDWIMLSKHYGFATPTQGFSVFRWFRIVAMDQDTRRGLLSEVSTQASGGDPYDNNADLPIWSRDVVLEGTDWSFAPTAGSATLLTPTTGTLMSNVVTVIERNVQID